jgi:IclR family pca regulon transcriptional regulator
MNSDLQKRDFAQTLARGLHCLEVLSEKRTLATCSEVAAAMQVSRAAARRILLTLEHLGYVGEEGARYASTPKVLSLGRGVLGEGGLWSRVAPQVVALADRLNEPCSVAVLDGLEILFVCRDATRRIFTSRLGIGDRLPAHCSSSGKMLLASLPPGELATRLKGIKLERRAPASITSHRDLMAALNRARADGYALAIDEMEEGTVSVAVPIRERRGRVIAAINLASHKSRTTAADLAGRLLADLKATAAKIEGIVADFQDRNWVVV